MNHLAQAYNLMSGLFFCQGGRGFPPFMFGWSLSWPTTALNSTVVACLQNSAFQAKVMHLTQDEQSKLYIL